MQKESLDFTGKKATGNKGLKGFLYIHNFGTGYQELVFASHEAANKFKARLNTPEYIESLKQKA